MIRAFDNTLSSLRHPNYRIFIGGQAVSRIGTWMERTAVSWVVYDITHSTLMLGLAMFASQFPSFLFSIWGGIISDRYNRHRIVLITQLASMLQATILAVIILMGYKEIWAILGLITLLGTINAFDIPARQALVHQLVEDPKDLPNAVALNSSVVNIARLVGPALSGLILSTLGAGICFTINALSYLAVIVSLLFLKLGPQEYNTKKQSNWEQIKESIQYLRSHPQLGPILPYMAIVSLLVLPYNTLLPDFAKMVFHGNAQTYGYLASAVGSGALLGTIYLASTKQIANHGKRLLTNLAILGVALIGFSMMPFLSGGLLIAVLTGFCALTQSTICLTLIQTKSDPAIRGRVISLYAMALFGMLPLGSLLVGAISHRVGGAETMLGQGILALLISLLFYRVFIPKNHRKLG